MKKLLLIILFFTLQSKCAQSDPAYRKFSVVFTDMNSKERFFYNFCSFSFMREDETDNEAIIYLWQDLSKNQISGYLNRVEKLNYITSEEDGNLKFICDFLK